MRLWDFETIQEIPTADEIENFFHQNKHMAKGEDFLIGCNLENLKEEYRNVIKLVNEKKDFERIERDRFHSFTMEECLKTPVLKRLN